MQSAMAERMEYGQLGTQLRHTLPDGSVQTLSWLAGNRLAQLSLTEKGQTVAVEHARFFHYDENGRFFHYDENGRFRGKRLKNGVKSLYQFNEIGGLKQLKTFCANDNQGTTCSGAAKGTIFQDLRYDFDSIGQIRSIIDQRTNKTVNGINTDETQAFEYDSLGRLKTAWWGPENDRTEQVNFALGSGGNLEGRQLIDPKLNREIAGITFTYAGQRVVSGRNSAGIEIFHAEYDRFGNMSRRWKAADQTITTEVAPENRKYWIYRYDEEDRLVEVIRGSTLRLRFRYDANGNRIRKLWQGDEHWIDTWYLGESFEKRSYWKTGNEARHDITRYLIAPGHGKIASITKRYNDAEYGQLLSEWNTLFASTMNDPTLPGKLNQGGYYLKGFYQNPNFFARVWVGLMLTLLSGTLLLALRTEIRIIKGRETSRFARWQRALAITTLIPFFLISCDSERRGTTESAANGPIITGINQAITGTTYEYEGLPEGTHYYHVNHLGSSSVITDETGRQVTRINYNPYGEIVQDRSDGKNSVTEKFTGQELDEEMDLYYYGARYYDPFTGRFLRADTIVPDPLDSQAFNRYMYVIGNPIIYDDPTGHWTGSCMMCGMSDNNGETPSSPTHGGNYDYDSGSANQKTWDYAPKTSPTRDDVVGGKFCSICSKAPQHIIDSDYGIEEGPITPDEVFDSLLEAAGVPAMFRLFNPKKLLKHAGKKLIKKVGKPLKKAKFRKPKQPRIDKKARKSTFPDNIFSKKAPPQVIPGTKKIKGQYMNNKGRVEPWTAHYDSYGRLKGRTDYNAGNKKAGIADVHHHTYEWGPGKNPLETGSHLLGEY